MIQNVNFSATPNIYKGFLNTTDNGEKVVVVGQPVAQSPLKTILKTTANAKKVGVYATDVPKGIVKAGLIGLITGGAMMSFDWLIGAAAGRNGATAGTILTTPFKTAGELINSAGKKVAKAFDKSILEIASYPFTKFVPQVVRYVKNVKSVSKTGKAVAVAAGSVAAGLSVLGTMININRKTADIDHGYRVGHRVP